jgi:protein SDA1
MGMSDKAQPLPFGHSAEAAVDIEGLAVCNVRHCWRGNNLTNNEQLLEDHLEKLRAEESYATGGAEDNDAAWEGWDVESESSQESSEDEGWIEVVSDDDDHFNLSDSEDEQPETTKPKTDEPSDAVATNRVSTLATTKVRFITIYSWSMITTILRSSPLLTL